MDLFTAQGGLVILRWFHFLAGITWIGMLYYFNFVQTPFFGKTDANVKNGMISGLVPEALWWFRWGAMFTILTGLLAYGTLLHMQGAESWSTPPMILLLAGMLMGAMMWFNVWFIIWPAQKIVIASTRQVMAGGQAIPEAASRGAVAGRCSRTNTLLSVPMLLFMGGRNLSAVVSPEGGSPWPFLIAAIVLIALIEWNAVSTSPLPTQKMLAKVGSTLHAGLAAAILLLVLAILLV
jgi:uncharacterized membrane protein